MPSLSFIVARTKLSFVHYTRQFPWCAVRLHKISVPLVFFRAPSVSTHFYRMRNVI